MELEDSAWLTLRITTMIRGGSKNSEIIDKLRNEYHELTQDQISYQAMRSRVRRKRRQLKQ